MPPPEPRGATTPERPPLESLPKNTTVNVPIVAQEGSPLVIAGLTRLAGCQLVTPATEQQQSRPWGTSPEGHEAMMTAHLASSAPPSRFTSFLQKTVT